MYHEAATREAQVQHECNAYETRARDRAKFPVNSGSVAAPKSGTSRALVVDMLFRQLFDAESGTYTYLLADGPGADAVILDPVASQIESYLRLAGELDVKIAYAMDTHVHADHVSALGALRERTGAITIMGEQSRADCVSRTVKDGDVIQVGSLSIRAMHTPGHTDFQNGDARAEYRSIFDKLLTLPDATRVYPGHDYKGWTESTVAEERAHNPRLQVKDEAEFVALMNGLNLPNPKLMDIAVPANLRCGRTTSINA